MTNPYKIVEMFEEAIADYCGSKYAVAVESCTIAIFLSLEYKNAAKDKMISIPKLTYPGVANSIIHAGGNVVFDDRKWEGEYELIPLNIWDAALRFKKGMYHGGLQCLSFHGKKLIPIGRGGAILTNDENAYKWFKLMRFDGRNPIPLQQDTIRYIGYNCYMQPEQAARGLQLIHTIGDKDLADLPVESQKYSDLSKQPAYQQ